MSTRRERVLKRLQKAQGGAEGFVCMRSLTHPTVGGNRAGARLHELREAGVALERKFPCDCTDCRYFALQAERRGDPPSRLTAWRLASVTAEDRQMELLG